METPVAAGLAWYIAHTLLGHHQPFFAPTAAAVSLSKNKVLRSQRALQLVVGVVLGIGAGTAVKAVAGSAGGTSGALAGIPGAVTIAAAVAVTLLASVSLGGGFFEQGVLFVNQATTSAILMIAVAGAATATERLSDALVGGGVALMITVVLFPAAPMPLIENAARQVFAALRDTVADLVDLEGGPDGGGAPGPEWILAAGQRIHGQLAGLQQAGSTARQVAIFAPRYWPQRSRIRMAAEDQAAPLHLLAASVLSLAHACVAGSGSGGSLPWSPALRGALGELRSVFAALAEGDDAASGRVTQCAARVRALAAREAGRVQQADGVQENSAHSRFIAMLVETCADDTIRYALAAGDQG